MLHIKFSILDHDAYHQLDFLHLYCKITPLSFLTTFIYQESQMLNREKSQPIFDRALKVLVNGVSSNFRYLGKKETPVIVCILQSVYFFYRMSRQHGGWSRSNTREQVGQGVGK